ncbi:hypothetical protein GBAR_LOCUS17977, partial [Geodia barretti]
TLVLIGLVLGSASLQLQSASAYRYRGRVRAQSSISLIPNVEQYFQEGLKSLQGKSVCEHLQTVLPRLSSGGKIHFSASGPPTPDNSLLNNADFWGSASLQHS